jgi:sensor domain CHASE-containing protein
MSVKLKTLLISIISFIVITVLMFIVFKVIIFKYINEIEIKELNYNFQVVQSLLNREENNINRTTIDWAHWDDCYNFVMGKNKEIFIKENLQGSTLDELNLDFMFFAGAQGNMVYSITNGIGSKTKDLLITKILNKSNKGI